MNEIAKCNRLKDITNTAVNSFVKSKCSVVINCHVFSDIKLTPPQAQMLKSQTGKNNKMLFHLPPVS